MKAASLGMTLILFAALAACGDASSPEGGSGKPQAGSAAQAGSAPADVLASLPPEARPYGLDVYTAKCLNCHGDLGQGIGKNPALKGLTRAAMQQKLRDYRAGKPLEPQTAVMAKTVASLSDAEIAAVSIYAGE